MITHDAQTNQEIFPILDFLAPEAQGVKILVRNKNVLCAHRSRPADTPSNRVQRFRVHSQYRMVGAFDGTRIRW